MPLQNRVDPSGEIRAVAERGLFTGNRGVIHDPETKTLLKRRWTTKAWIICTLGHPRGVRREAMGRNAPSGGAGWTELFFLDEVTALAAGHRPCFYCRREAAVSFQRCFGQAADSRTTAPEMDAMLHAQRLALRPALGSTEISALPEGAIITVGKDSYAVRDGRALRWSFAGYGDPEPLPETATLTTPPATVAALRNGYAPVWHPSARQTRPRTAPNRA